MTTQEMEIKIAALSRYIKCNRHRMTKRKLQEKEAALAKLRDTYLTEICKPMEHAFVREEQM